MSRFIVFAAIVAASLMFVVGCMGGETLTPMNSTMILRVFDAQGVRVVSADDHFAVEGGVAIIHPFWLPRKPEGVTYRLETSVRYTRGLVGGGEMDDASFRIEIPSGSTRVEVSLTGASPAGTWPTRTVTIERSP